MKDVALHIGTHKTGSTAIQLRLVDFDNGSTFYSQTHLNHSIPLYTVFSQNYLSYHYWTRLGKTLDQIEEKKKHYAAQLRRELSRDERQRIIFSGEDISELRVNEKKAMLEFFDEFGLNVKVYCYVRSPLSYIASAVQEMIKHGEMSFANSTAFLPKYKEKIYPFIVNLPSGSVMVKEFDKAKLVGGDVVKDFCEELDIIPSRPGNGIVNASLSAPATKLIYVLNRLPILTEGNEKQLRQRAAFIEILRLAYIDHKPFKPALAERLLDDIKNQIDFLIDNFAIDFSSDGFGEVDDLDAYLTDLTDVDPDPLDRLLDYYLLDCPPNATFEQKLILLYYAVAFEQVADSARREKRLSDLEISLSQEKDLQSLKDAKISLLQATVDAQHSQLALQEAELKKAWRDPIPHLFRACVRKFQAGLRRWKARG